jgi:hypothetical protein
MIQNKMISTFSDLGHQPGDWARLPIQIRQRWWSETDYGANPPTDDLKQAIKEALDVVSKPAA